MKIIKPSVEFFGAVPTDYANTLRFIEVAGRTCYKSEDKIGCLVPNEDFIPDLCAEYGNWDDVKGGPVNCNAGCAYHSAPKFVKRLINAGHLAMVEHSNFVVKSRIVDYPMTLQGDLGKYLTVFVAGMTTYVGGNITAWMKQYDSYPDDDNAWDDSCFTPFFEAYGEMFGRGNEGQDTGWQVCPHDEIPKELHRYSAKFICDRGVSHELVRHRPCSFAQESTRYVNYGGKDMEFIEPWWCNDAYGTNNGAAQWSNFEQMCLFSEELYKDQLERGQAPQAARAVLPNALKTEIIVTADTAEWAHIKKLRTHPSAHPDMVRVMNMLPWEEMGL